MRAEWTLLTSPMTIPSRCGASASWPGSYCRKGGPAMKFEGKFEGREFPPRDARIDTRYNALVRLDRGAVGAEILNLSGMGSRLRLATEGEAGEEVTLEAPTLEPVKAVLRWVPG